MTQTPWPRSMDALTARRAGFFDRLRRCICPSPLWERYARAEGATRSRQHLRSRQRLLSPVAGPGHHAVRACAWVSEPGLCLEGAQRAKAHSLCRKLRLRPVKPSWRPAVALGRTGLPHGPALQHKGHGLRRVQKDGSPMHAPTSRRRDWRRQVHIYRRR